MRIAKVGVLGAGAMGSGIAALAASAGVPVVLLDIPGQGSDRSSTAREALARAAKAKPAPFMDQGAARLIEVGNFDEDLRALADCDLIIEAIIEQTDPKQ
ncbi:MAG TPA: 3-hydroxyacyl-CoA dehydrogenase NAD-binding domain-containing protein, partial [Gemmatimonadaceae bacterium]|nr:3-hydroxyacyl-CoA dehydrogenase NAD-binding domain-containing protein [Gemmatimonadaceae bacterium]